MRHGTLIVIPLVAILSGCGLPPSSTIALDVAAIVSGAVDSMEEEARNFYEPFVLSSNKDRIKIKYLTVNDNAMHDEVVQLINVHCDGSYIETSRQEQEGWTIVDAECISRQP